MDNNKSGFSVSGRAKSFGHAGRGLVLFLRNTHNSWIQIFLMFVALVLGFYFDISKLEWLVTILASGLVLTAEALNTAIENDIDLTSPDYHPIARDTKDISAAAVLIASISALAVGLIIFVPY